MIVSRKIIIMLTLAIAFGTMLGVIGAHGAQVGVNCTDVGPCVFSGTLSAQGTCTGDKNVFCSKDSDCVTSCPLDNPLPSADIMGLICLIITFISTKLMPPAVVLMVLWASFLFLTAAGQPGKVMQARTTLVWAVIGTAILLMAVPLVSLVMGLVGGTAPAQCSGTAATANVISVVAALINWFTWFLAVLSVGVGLYAGFLYMTSRGEPQKVSTAGRVIFYAVIGILVAIIAFSIQSIITNFIQ